MPLITIPHPDTPGREGFREFCRALARAFPDARFDPQYLVADDEHACVPYTLTATQGSVRDIPATGKRTEVRGVQVGRFENAQIIEHQGSTDELGIMQQIGAIPPSPETSQKGAKNNHPFCAFPSDASPRPSQTADTRLRAIGTRYYFDVGPSPPLLQAGLSWCSHKPLKWRYVVLPLASLRVRTWRLRSSVDPIVSARERFVARIVTCTRARDM